MPDGDELIITTDGEYIALFIKDSGSGMAAEMVDRAFEPFFTTKETGKGAGLGLRQVYGTLHQSGGSARIESSPGAGTTVRLYLRRPDAARSATKAPEAPDAVSADLFAEDGPASLPTLERIVPDAMILDFAMPGMNGAAVAKIVQDPPRGQSYSPAAIPKRRPRFGARRRSRLAKAVQGPRIEAALRELLD
ncbi:ATP-binding protein [Bradyrhizobium sp. CCGB12]|nr:ATP-binding protein [Bradyrhizobium sp. CCGB12]MCP3392081.1 ATP-binding protein [Bradyrhizobium sp. CCGB12]